MRVQACAVLLCFFAVSATAVDIKTILSKIQNELLKGTYKAQVEVNMETEDGSVNKTYTIQEYHDGEGGVHSIKFVSEGTQIFYYQNLPDKNFIVVGADGKCEQSTIEQATSVVENFVTKVGSIHKPEYYLGPTGIIQRIPTEYFINATQITDDVRGIKADLFVYSEGEKDTDWQISLYFSVDTWTDYVISKDQIKFPLRIVMNDKKVGYQIEFFEFEALDEKTLFRLGDSLQLPYNRVGCALTVPAGMEPPDLGDQISFTTEEETGVPKTEYFDIDAKLYRSDTENGESIVQDDVHGIVYTLSDTCDSKPNQALTSVNIANGAASAGVMIVHAYLNMTHKFYVGETVVRGMPVEIWEGQKNDLFTSARFYFTKKNVAVSLNHQNESQILVKAELQLNNEESSLVDANVFDFYSTLDSLAFRKNFDVEECQYESTFVEILYQSDTEFKTDIMELSTALEEVAAQTDDAILESTAMSAVQLPYIKVDVLDSRHITAYAKILASPSYLAAFTERPERYQHYNTPPIDSVTDQDCARQCVEAEGDCATMLFCSGEKHCYLEASSDNSTWGNIIAQSAKNCVAYDKSSTVDKYAFKPLENITRILEGAILEGLPQFRFSIKNEEGKFELQAVQFQSHMSEFNDEGNLGPYTREFVKKSLSEKSANTLVVENIATVGDCYRQCTSNTDMACGSFSICTDTKRCVLSNLNINTGSHHDEEQKDVLVSGTASCNIYSMNYLMQFDRLAGKTRKSGNLAQDKGKTAGDCALDCRQKEYDALDACRSFDFCPRKQMCFFYDTHYNWDGGDSSLQDDPDCDHYALRFSADYIAMGKVKLSGLPTKKVEGISMEECAKQCSELSDNECQTITYCDDQLGKNEKQTCYQYGGLIENASDDETVNTCTTYMKDATVMNEVINPERQTEKEQTTLIEGMSNGGFAALLIAMLAIGAAIGGFGYVKRDKVSALTGRFRSGGGSGGPSSTTISYNRQDDP